MEAGCWFAAVMILFRRNENCHLCALPLCSGANQGQPVATRESRRWLRARVESFAGFPHHHMSPLPSG